MSCWHCGRKFAKDEVYFGKTIEGRNGEQVDTGIRLCNDCNEADKKKNE